MAGEPGAAYGDAYLTVREAAQELKLHERTIRRWINRRWLEADQLPDGRYRIRRRWLYEVPAHLQPVTSPE